MALCNLFHADNIGAARHERAHCGAKCLKMVGVTVELCRGLVLVTFHKDVGMFVIGAIELIEQAVRLVLVDGCNELHRRFFEVLRHAFLDLDRRHDAAHFASPIGLSW